ncbi:hypothetical protein J6590_097053 [Homalodisca vitripennis]|nr:hypothetical protein J6590_097053 [Homalodisca vitripennis]
MLVIIISMEVSKFVECSRTGSKRHIPANIKIGKMPGQLWCRSRCRVGRVAGNLVVDPRKTISSLLIRKGAPLPVARTRGFKFRIHVIDL